MTGHTDVSCKGWDNLSSLNFMHSGFFKENIACYAITFFFKNHILCIIGITLCRIFEFFYLPLWLCNCSKQLVLYFILSQQALVLLIFCHVSKWVWVKNAPRSPYTWQLSWFSSFAFQTKDSLQNLPSLLPICHKVTVHDRCFLVCKPSPLNCLPGMSLNGTITCISTGWRWRWRTWPALMKISLTICTSSQQSTCSW